MTIGEKILNMRKARGWSQEDLAEQVGVSRQAVSRWESGTAKPDADKIIAICDLFGVSADYLLRDMAAGGQTAAEEAVQGVKTQRPRTAWALTAFGGITLFILGILASVNRKYVMPVHEASSDGMVSVVRPGYYTGFGDYIESMGLEWLAWLAAISLIAGAGCLFWLRYGQRKEEQEEQR